MRKLFIISVFFVFLFSKVNAQMPNPALVGYWHNWNASAPYIQLNQIDPRYNVIEVSFAEPTSATDMTMTFTPDVVTQATLISQIATLQGQGKKVLISIGGANTSVDLTTPANKTNFITSMGTILNTYGFDGMDIDIEHGNSIVITSGTIASPANISQINLIDAIKQIMANYKAQHSKKMLLTMAPETAYVQGGQSAFGSIWGGYLPIINALRDSLDILQVQLYNSGTMYGIDGNIYTQGTADFVIAMTEAVIHGFNTTGGNFAGIPASKVAVGLPACQSAAGGGYIDSTNLKAALKYLLGQGPKPGTYTLNQTNGYPTLRGMMTWSINWDAMSTCASTYEYARIYQKIFNPTTGISAENNSQADITIFPNPAKDEIFIHDNFEQPLASTLYIYDFAGKAILTTEIMLGKHANTPVDISLFTAGIYLVKINNAKGFSYFTISKN